MSLPTQGPRAVRLGNFHLDLRTGELWQGRNRIRLQEKPFRILAVLIERHGDIVTREELRKRLWSSQTFGDFDHSLNNAVNRLRETLHDSSESPRFIETLPKLGYRFIGPIDPLEENASVPENLEREEKRSSNHDGRAHLGFWVALGVALAFLVIPAGIWYRAELSSSPRVTLAVLPFQNLSGDPALEFVCDGLTVEVISQLDRENTAGIAVLARTSSMAYKNSRKPLHLIGRELGVDYVVEGSVRLATDRWRVTARLVRVSDLTHMWTGNFNHPQGNVLNLQEEVASAISQQIRSNLRPPGETHGTSEAE